MQKTTMQLLHQEILGFIAEQGLSERQVYASAVNMPQLVRVFRSPNRSVTTATMDRLRAFMAGFRAAEAEDKPCAPYDPDSAQTTAWKAGYQLARDRAQKEAAA